MQYRTLNQTQSSTLNSIVFRILNMNLLSERLAYIQQQNPDLDGDKGQMGLAKASGASKSVVHQWVTGKIKSMDIRYALNIERELGYSHIWLMTGEGEPRVPAQMFPRGVMGVHIADKDDEDFVQIPMVKLKLQAGVTGFQTEPDRRDGGTLGMRRNWVERRGYNPASLVAIEVKGASMETSLYEGDIVIVNTADRTPRDGDVFAVNYEGEAVVKRLFRNMGRWFLASDNPDQSKYPRKACDGDQCILVGKIVHKESDHI